MHLKTEEREKKSAFVFDVLSSYMLSPMISQYQSQTEVSGIWGQLMWEERARKAGQEEKLK